MPITSRAFNSNEDFESIMQFLCNTYKTTNSLQNWFPDRFEGSDEVNFPDIRIWEDMANSDSPLKRKIVAVASPEKKLRYFIQINPEYSFLEKEIIQWIENHCSALKKNPNTKEKLSIVTVEGNSVREEALTEFGFEHGDIYGILRIRPLDTPISDVSLPNGFTIRSVQGRSDYEKLAQGVRIVFGHGEWFTAEIIEWITKRSFYKQDLDLVVVAPDDTIASFCTFRIDPRSRITQLEPMGTHPDYRRLGLAKAILNEGFKRLKKYNPALIYIGGAADTPAANRLYEAVGFTEKLEIYFWYKEI
ncbi:MAG: GNAT family N-acetyltransferase [Candidatus Hodarchaeota archaeon]